MRAIDSQIEKPPDRGFLGFAAETVSVKSPYENPKPISPYPPSADYSLPSWVGQVQAELPAKEEGEEQQAQER